MRRGQIVVGRPLPVGDAHRIFGGMVDLSLRHARRPDTGRSTEIATVLGAVFRPPRLTNADGEDPVAHTLT